MSSRKGKDPRAGEPLFYDEKKKQVSMQLTPTAIAAATVAAKRQGISRSELIEQLLRRGEAWLVEQVRGKQRNSLAFQESVEPVIQNQCLVCGRPAKVKYCSVKCSNTAQARKSREIRKVKNGAE